jgi:formate dehydrogenase iron-sulfur subunit
MAEIAMLNDVSKCMACRGCQVACKQWNGLTGETTDYVGTYENPPDFSANTWTRVLFREEIIRNQFRWLFRKHQCMHCTEAVCVKVCQHSARGYHPLGFVTIDWQKCQGCGRCERSCPFKVPKVGTGPAQDVEQVAYNCIFCADRVTNGLTPACAKSCPSGAIIYGYRSELIDRGKARVDTLKEEGYPNASLYGDTERSRLHVMYVLPEKISLYDLPSDADLEAAKVNAAALLEGMLPSIGIVGAMVGITGLGIKCLTDRSERIKQEEEIAQGAKR